MSHDNKEQFVTKAQLDDFLYQIKIQRQEDLAHMESQRKEDFDKLMEILKPITESYGAAIKLGKWGTTILVTISIIIGILLGIKNLIKI